MISAIVLTKNEEKILDRCLKSLSWCGEIIVVDDGSTDRTLKVAQKYTAHIYSRKLNNNFSGQRNYGLGLAKGKWILFVDADEEVTPALQQEIKSQIGQEGVNGFYLKRKDFLFGRWLKYGETPKVRLLRLARRGAGYWSREVDEIWEVKGPTKTLTNSLLHYHHQTLAGFLEALNERSTLNAESFFKQGQRLNLKEWLKPSAKFIQNYLFRLGFLDGIPGLLLAVLMSFHSFLVRGKLYLLWRKKRGNHEGK
jgi:glycosyltransferase involved in cell wall biosynthesis